MAALVTGGGGFLGLAVGRALAAAGHDVVATVLDEAEAARYDGAGRAVVVDLRDRAAIDRLASGLGPLSAMVCCAGGFSMQALTASSPAQLDQLLDLNVRTAANCLAGLGPSLSPGAGVVLVGAATWRGAAGVALYAATKAAVVSLGRSAAQEWRERGVRVNVVLPDILDTPANRRAMPDADVDRWARPDEVAATVRWLCSAEARLISGQAIELSRGGAPT